MHSKPVRTQGPAKYAIKIRNPNNDVTIAEEIKRIKRIKTDPFSPSHFTESTLNITRTAPQVQQVYELTQELSTRSYFGNSSRRADTANFNHNYPSTSSAIPSGLSMNAVLDYINPLNMCETCGEFVPEKGRKEYYFDCNHIFCFDCMHNLFIKTSQKHKVVHLGCPMKQTPTSKVNCNAKLKLNLRLEIQFKPYIDYDEKTSVFKRCEVCYENFLEDPEFLKMFNCSHIYCLQCSQNYLHEKTNLMDILTFGCPECKDPLVENRLSNFLTEEQIIRFEYIKSNAKVSKDANLKFCSKPGCKGTVKRHRPDQYKVICEVCQSLTCFDCGHAYHGTKNCSKAASENFAAYLAANRAKNCPNCRVPIIKNEGCNHMTCIMCKHDWCWVCKEPTKVHHNHNEIIEMPMQIAVAIRNNSTCQKVSDAFDELVFSPFEMMNVRYKKNCLTRVIGFLLLPLVLVIIVLDCIFKLLSIFNIK